MTGFGERTLDVAYANGWDGPRGVLLGPLSERAAAGRDAAGEPYAVVIKDGGPSGEEVGASGCLAGVVVLHVDGGRGYVGLWLYDAQGRRVGQADLRRIEERRLFLRERRTWRYGSAETAEFAADAGRVTLRWYPDGQRSECVEPEGDRGGSRRSFGSVDVGQQWLPAPEFGQWDRLLPALGLESEGGVRLRTSGDALPGVPVDLDGTANWRAPEPMRPRLLDEQFTPGTRIAAHGEVYVTLAPHPAGQVHLPSGRLVTRDPTYAACAQDSGFTVTVAPGSYPVEIAFAAYETERSGRALAIDEITAARVRISDRPTVRWESALLEGQDPRLLGDGEFYGFGVDGGLGSFVDATAAGALGECFFDEMGAGRVREDGEGVMTLDDPESGANLIAFPSGRGDGSYPVWIGRDGDGHVTCFVADLCVLHRGQLS